MIFLVLFTFSTLIFIGIMTGLSIYSSSINFEKWGNTDGENDITVTVDAYPDPEEPRNKTFTFPRVS